MSELVAASLSESEIFDPAEAMDRACDDLELLAELAELFAENRDRLLVELAEAVAVRDGDRIAHVAHTLKGSIGTFSTRRPYHLARELEFSGKNQSLEDVPLLFDALKSSLAQLDAAVTHFLSSHR